MKIDRRHPEKLLHLWFLQNKVENTAKVAVLSKNRNEVGKPRGSCSPRLHGPVERARLSPWATGSRRSAK